MFGNSDRDEDNRHQAEHGRYFATLREANEARQKEWDGDGHAMNDDWRLNELMGEVGEVCNTLKKLHRESLGIPGSRATQQDLAAELADVLICLDLVLMTANGPPAEQAPIYPADLGQPRLLYGRGLFQVTAYLDRAIVSRSTYEIAVRARDMNGICQALAATEGIDLNAAVRHKFNETTRKVGLTTFLDTPA